MSDGTSIEWTDATWSPLRARRRDTGKVGQHCERVSPGCTNCYAATHNRRNLPNGGTGLDYVRGSRDLVETFVDERVLTQPLRWRVPKRVFVCNQTDLFADFYTEEQRDRVFAVMALAPQHTFQVLTKRPERMREYVADRERWNRIATIAKRGLWVGARAQNPFWPLPNVWLGVTAEDQQRADERIPILLDTPAALRFVSAEPLLGPVNLAWIPLEPGHTGTALEASENHEGDGVVPAIDWIIVGGESGPGARPCNVAWIRSIVAQCRDASAPCFVKQLGAKPHGTDPDPRHGRFPCAQGAPYRMARIWMRLHDRKGGDPSEWPADLRVREFPEAATCGGAR